MGLWGLRSALNPESRILGSRNLGLWDLGLPVLCLIRHAKCGRATWIDWQQQNQDRAKTRHFWPRASKLQVLHRTSSRESELCCRTWMEMAQKKILISCRTGRYLARCFRMPRLAQHVLFPFLSLLVQVFKFNFDSLPAPIGGMVFGQDAVLDSCCVCSYAFVLNH